MNRVIRTFIYSMLLFQIALAQKSTMTGSIYGKVIDAETHTPLIGANVMIMNTTLGAATDQDGNFMIGNVPAGSYSVQFRFIGYDVVVQADIIVRPQRITTTEAKLKMSPLESREVVVTAGYFPENDDHPLSMTSFSYEEVRRAPGSGGDISRIMLSLPSVAKVNDQSNSLIVRGGNPMENAFYIDNIEVPNVNHFPMQGATGGAIGMVNVDFIRSVNFNTGGFSAAFGDKLSSIMEIDFREGNQETLDAQLDLNWAGFGGVAEGPLFHGKGSWLVSARRSYLDLVVKTIDVGSSIAPVYGDYQSKLVYNMNPNHKIELLYLGGDDHNTPGRDVAQDNKMLYYGTQDIYQNTVGVNWRALWDRNGYSNTSLSWSSSLFEEEWWETNTAAHFTKNSSHEQWFSLRNVNHFRINERHSVQFGCEGKFLNTRYDNIYDEHTDPVGNQVPRLLLQEQIHGNKIGAFAQYIVRPTTRLSLTLGGRADYFSYNRKSTLSPRLSVSYQLSDLTAIHGAAGIYYQNLPSILLALNRKDKQDPKSVHYVLGASHLLTESTQLTLEVYYKDYDRFPMDPAQPEFFIIDEMTYSYGFYTNHAEMTDAGKAGSKGVELLLQKKLAKKFYGLASASYFQSRYRGMDHVWRNRVYDNRLIFGLEGGYKPGNKWEFSLRWVYAGGTPCTPLDLAQSRMMKQSIYDGTRINAERYPAYHSMNIRFDKRFLFNRSNIVVYVSVWNVYNHKNVATYFWNDKEVKQDTIYQWTILPVFGVEYEL